MRLIAYAIAFGVLFTGNPCSGSDEGVTTKVALETGKGSFVVLIDTKKMTTGLTLSDIQILANFKDSTGRSIGSQTYTYLDWRFPVMKPKERQAFRLPHTYTQATGVSARLRASVGVAGSKPDGLGDSSVDIAGSAATKIEPTTMPSPRYWSIEAFGLTSRWCGSDTADLDGDKKPDLVLMAYDEGAGSSEFRYRIGSKLDLYEEAANWRSEARIPGFGRSDGAGVALGEIDGAVGIDILLMAYEQRPQANVIRYKIGFGLNSAGKAVKWSGDFSAPGMGWSGAGAGATLHDLDQNGVLDVVFVVYDQPTGRANNFRYRIGWNLHKNGAAQSWSEPHVVPSVGAFGEGAGVTIGDFDQNGRSDIVLLGYSKNNGLNDFVYRIGWDLDRKGEATSWSAATRSAGVGMHGQGAGLSTWQIPYDTPHLVFLAQDHERSRTNQFRMRAIRGTALRADR